MNYFLLLFLEILCEKNRIYSGTFIKLLLQVIPQIVKIDDENRKQIYLDVLSDQFCLSILTSIINQPKTAVVVAKETGIPISTVYRRLQSLQENKLLKVSGGINKDGKYFIYQSKIKEVSTKFDGISTMIHVTPNLNFTIM